MTKRALIPGSLILLTISTAAHARWESFDETIATSQYDQTFEVNKDGTYKVTREEKIDIKKDGARTVYGTVPMRYNSGRAKVLAVDAETIDKGKSTKVPKDQIEDKPEKAQNVGFDKTNSLAIAFPNVKVGSTLHYRVTWLHHSVPLKNQFSEKVYFGSATATVPPSKTRIVSKIPLNVEIKDPEKYLAVDHHREGENDVVEIKLLRPVDLVTVNEKRDGWFKESPYPQVSVSTMKDWADIGKAFSPDYENELTQTLPIEFAAIADKAKASQKNFVDRANSFTSDLAELVRYHGDWRTRKGSYIPRPLAEIRSSGYGDCKDMALVTAASLRHMGYKANVALVNRGFDIPKAALLPAVSAFNHAIVRAENEKGEVQWIDPTNSSSYAQAIRADIAGRPALIVDGANSHIEMTTALKPEDSVTLYTRSFDFLPGEDRIKSVMQISFKGLSSESMTGWELIESKRRIEERLLSLASDSAEIFESKVEPFDLSSRTVRDLDFKLSYTAAHVLENTTAGLAYNLTSSLESLAELDTKGRMSGYNLGTPNVYSSVRVIKSAEMIGKASEPCKVESPWLDAERKIEAKDEAIQITESMRVKSYGIGTDELASAAFKTLQKSLQRCVGSYTIIFKKTDGSEVAATH